MKNSRNKTGACVHLVGTGPGDAELLTVKALRLIQTADVIVYDRLVSGEILQQIPAGTTRIYVGKCTGQHTLVQDEINALLVRLAETERVIVRLKGGDPFIFGRGSEEARYLGKHGVRFEVVPGITAASACTTYAGIPLTHRGLARSVQFVSGHAQNDQPLDLNWRSLADEDKTLVIYMGVANIAYISQQLIEAGLPASTPVAAIENGAGSRQRRMLCELNTLPQKMLDEAMQAPVIFVIGRVVTLATELDWYVGNEDLDVVEGNTEDNHAQSYRA